MSEKIDESIVKQEGNDIAFPSCFLSYPTSGLPGEYGYCVHAFTGCLVCLARIVDRSVGLHGQNEKFQLRHTFRQTPKAIEEGPAILEVVGNETITRRRWIGILVADSIESGAVALILDAEK